MRDLLARLRAALTPQAVALLFALMLLFSAAVGDRNVHPGKTALEERIEKALGSLDGAGRVSVVLHTRQTAGSSGAFSAQSMQEEIVGAVAVAEGADDPLIRMEIQEALCTLLGLPVSAVSVMIGGI